MTVTTEYKHPKDQINARAEQTKRDFAASEFDKELRRQQLANAIKAAKLNRKPATYVNDLGEVEELPDSSDLDLDKIKIASNIIAALSEPFTKRCKNCGSVIENGNFCQACAKQMSKRLYGGNI